MADDKISQLPAATAFKGGHLFPTSQDLETTPVTRKMTGDDMRGALVGFMSNGYISRTVASNNLTVAIKTKNAADPSANDITSVAIGSTGTQRQITGALSVTVNAGAASGAGTFNLGHAMFAALEQDLFVYLGWRASTSTVFILLSRIPYARTYADFSATAANELYGAYSGAAPASTDEVEVIGRVNVTNSGTASYNWSVPATSVVISRPIFETRWLTYVPIWTSTGTQPAIGDGTNVGRYRVRYQEVLVRGRTTAGATTTFGTGTYSWPLPFTAATFTNAAFSGSGRVVDASVTTTYVALVSVGSAGAALSIITHSATGAMSGTVPVTLASSDSITYSVEYAMA